MKEFNQKIVSENRSGGRKNRLSHSRAPAKRPARGGIPGRLRFAPEERTPEEFTHFASAFAGHFLPRRVVYSGGAEIFASEEKFYLRFGGTYGILGTRS